MSQFKNKETKITYIKDRGWKLYFNFLQIYISLSFVSFLYCFLSLYFIMFNLHQ